MNTLCYQFSDNVRQENTCKEPISNMEMLRVCTAQRTLNL